MDSFRCCAIAGICLAVFLICLPMFSQGSTGRILGIVTDQSGAVIPGVTVIIRDVDRGTARTLTTDEAGAYSAPSLLTYAIPGIKAPGQILQGWSLNSIVSLQSGLPWGVNDTTTDFSGTGEVTAQNTTGERWNFFGSPADFKTSKSLLNTNDGAGGIPYFPGISNADCLARATAAGPLAVASLTNLGCYAMGSSVLVPPAYGSYGTLGRNVFRSMPYYNWDLSVTKAWKFRERVTTQFRAEFFNVLNHPNISNPFGGPGGDNSFTDPSAAAGSSFGFRPETPDVTSSNPVLGSGGPRAIQLGLKVIF